MSDVTLHDVVVLYDSDDPLMSPRGITVDGKELLVPAGRGVTAAWADNSVTEVSLTILARSVTMEPRP